MKYYLLLLIPFLIGCKKEVGISKNCDFNEILHTGLHWESSNDTPLKLNSQNFWTYSDSLFKNGTFDNVQSTLIKIDRIYELDGYYAVNFSSILPLLLVKNDTLFSTELTPEEHLPNCYQTYYPMFFNTMDSVVIDQNKSLEYRAQAINTEVGTYSNNLIFRESESLEIIVNENVGILKISFYLIENGQKTKRRILTIKDFNVK